MCLDSASGSDLTKDSGSGDREGRDGSSVMQSRGKESGMPNQRSHHLTWNSRSHLSGRFGKGCEPGDEKIGTRYIL